ncbi:MAG: 16S rRNA (guanine(527)-N(7))-methyltransferase RsmG [Janthinobacterium lividum]
MEEIITQILQRGANETWHLTLSDMQIAQFVRYAELLVEWNATRMNLTRIVVPADIAVKHFLDSLALLTVLTPPPGARVLDVGTGAGLPGMALKIARPDLCVTLLDSTAKKLLFCRAVADDLGLDSVEIVHARAEEVVKHPDLAGQFDLVTARAVAPMETLLPWLAPFVAPHGQLAALKGASVAEEMTAARSVARRLGLKLDKPYAVKLPEAEEETVRQIVVGRR